jgi:hypothetical protein
MLRRSAFDVLGAHELRTVANVCSLDHCPTRGYARLAGSIVIRCSRAQLDAKGPSAPTAARSTTLADVGSTTPREATRTNEAIANTTTARRPFQGRTTAAAAHIKMTINVISSMDSPYVWCEEDGGISRPAGASSAGWPGVNRAMRPGRWSRRRVATPQHGPVLGPKSSKGTHIHGATGRPAPPGAPRPRGGYGAQAISQRFPSGSAT